MTERLTELPPTTDLPAVLTKSSVLGSVLSLVTEESDTGGADGATGPVCTSESYFWDLEALLSKQLQHRIRVHDVRVDG